MKRFVVALAVLLAVYGLARADYVIIIYNLGVVRENPGNAGMPGMPGGMLGALGGMGGAGMGGPMPGGAAGIGGNPVPGGMGGMPRPGGAAGIGGGPMPGGAAGIGGGAAGVGGGTGIGGTGIGGTGIGGGGPVPGGAAGIGGNPVPGGMGGGPVPGGISGGPRPGGMYGMPSGGMNGMAPGGAGAGGWQPPTGFGGMPGGGMGMGGMPGGGMGMGGMPGGGMGMGGMGMGGIGGFLPGGGVPEQNFTPLLAIAVVEVYKWGPGDPNPQQKTGIIKASHKFSPHGSYILPITLDRKMTSSLLKCETIHRRYDEQYKEFHPNGKATTDGLSLLAGWALKHGLLDEFVKVMEELGKLDQKDPAVVAFDQVQKEMAKPITKGDASDVWRAKVLDGYKVEKSEHYALLHNLEAVKPAEATSRLKRLEDTYRSFYYWFALQGKVMPVPDQRLVAVLVKHGDEFKRQQQIFDSLPTVSDGFLARRDNLAVFSLERTDLASEALARNTKSLWAQLRTDRDASLVGWPKDIKGERLEFSRMNATRQVEYPVAEIQTLALLERALQEDAEVASVTHEGTRQLLAAAGMLPRNVAVPEWLQFGWASFFETPKGALWMTVGAPNSSLLPELNYLGHYKAADKAGKLKDHTKALIDVITDADFREFAKNPKNEEARVKARTMAWSLTFFLANSHLDGLKRYHEELKKLPRDLEFDSQTLLLTFARAFDCLEASNPNKVNPAKMDKLAQDWHSYINSRPSEDEALQTELAKKQAELKAVHNPKAGDTPAPK